MDNQNKYYKMDYEESEEFICMGCNWSNERYFNFFDESLAHFLEMNFENREEIKYLKTSYEFKKWFSIYFSKRNQHIVEEVIKWSIEHNCWVFNHKMQTYTAVYKGRNSAAFFTYYSFFIKDYSEVDFDKEHYLRLFNTTQIAANEAVVYEAVINTEVKKKTTQESIWNRIFASLRSFII